MLIIAGTYSSGQRITRYSAPAKLLLAAKVATSVDNIQSCVDVVGTMTRSKDIRQHLSEVTGPQMRYYVRRKA